jgi:hypothetical protein
MTWLKFIHVEQLSYEDLFNMQQSLNSPIGPSWKSKDNWIIVTSQDVRLEIERTQKCALHSCIENLGNFRAFK